MSTSNEEERTVKPFAAYLQTTNKGRTHTDLSEGMHDLIEEVLRTGKPGTMTLTVNIKVDEPDSRRLKVTETVAIKMPKLPSRDSIFWADVDGNLVRSDPSQMSFGDIQAVPTPNVSKEAQA